uniref:Uncharacterized protein n=1 Tax=Heterorhabditis bacteriophora TaxID=37862 RepID=A0A1I7WB15_HETBA
MYKLIFIFIFITEVMNSTWNEYEVPTASISSHVLDISSGTPVKGIEVLTFIQNNDEWIRIGKQWVKKNKQNKNEL